MHMFQLDCVRSSVQYLHNNVPDCTQPCSSVALCILNNILYDFNVRTLISYKMLLQYHIVLLSVYVSRPYITCMHYAFYNIYVYCIQHGPVISLGTITHATIWKCNVWTVNVNKYSKPICANHMNLYLPPYYK